MYHRETQLIIMTIEITIASSLGTAQANRLTTFNSVLSTYSSTNQYEMLLDKVCAT